MLSMPYGGGEVGLEGTVEFVEVVGVFAGGVVAADVDADAVAAAVAVADGHPGERRRRAWHPRRVGKLAMWAVAGIVVDLETNQLMFSRQKVSNQRNRVYIPCGLGV